jgi:hypothetical protein
MKTQPKIKLTREQKKALDAYEFRLREEDRYLGSVFVTPEGQRRIEARTKEAYDHCVALGMTWEHGL